MSHFGDRVRSAVIAVACTIALLQSCAGPSSDVVGPAPFEGDSVVIVPSTFTAAANEPIVFRAQINVKLARPLFFRWEFDDSDHVSEGLDRDSLEYRFAESGPHWVRLTILDPTRLTRLCASKVLVGVQGTGADSLFELLHHFQTVTATFTGRNSYQIDTTKRDSISSISISSCSETFRWAGTAFGSNCLSESGRYPTGNSKLSSSSWGAISADCLSVDSLDLTSNAYVGSDPPGGGGTNYTRIERSLKLHHIRFTTITADSAVAEISGTQVEATVAAVEDYLFAYDGKGGYYGGTAFTYQSTDWNSTETTPALRIIFR